MLSEIKDAGAIMYRRNEKRQSTAVLGMEPEAMDTDGGADSCPVRAGQEPALCWGSIFAVVSDSQTILFLKLFSWVLQATVAALEPFVLGMLTNFDALPLDRIHNFLKMFVNNTEGGYSLTLEELSTFLSRMVSAGKIAAEGNVFRRVT